MVTKISSHGVEFPDGVAQDSGVVIPGMVAHFAMATPPAGWLKAEGQLVSRATYGRLFNAIGTLYGAGDGSTTFGLPDLRGEFVRGVDGGRGVDANRALGSAQAATRIDDRLDNAIAGAINVADTDTATAISGTYYAASVSGQTTTTRKHVRPRNLAMLACIKF